MSGIGVGLIGYGMAGRIFHAPLIGAVDGLRLCAVASSDPAKVAADLPSVRVHATADELLDDPEVELAVIATPNHLHAPQAARALERGRHVVIDKPFAETLEQARALCDLARRQGLLLSVFQNRRWDGDFLTLRRIVHEGSIGRPVSLESRFDRFRPQPTDRWRDRPGAGAGVWFDLGAHLVDQSLQLFGRPDTVSADIGVFRTGACVDDDFHVILGYPRLRVVLRASCLAAAETPRFVLQGEAGGYVKFGLDVQEAQLRRGETPGAPGWGADPRPAMLTRGEAGEQTPVGQAAGDYRRYYEAIRDAVAGRGDNPVPPEQACEVMEILELARQSQAQGRRLPLAGTSPPLDRSRAGGA
jgi:predicted dehydrogenase